VSDKNLLERLGIITNQSDDESESETTTTATVTPIVTKVETAEEVSPSVTELTFVDEKANNNNYAISVNKKSAVKVIKPIEEKQIETPIEKIEEPIAPVIEEPVYEAPIAKEVEPVIEEKITPKDDAPMQMELPNEVVESHTDDYNVESATYEPESIDFDIPKFEPYVPETYEEQTLTDFDKYVSIADLYRMYGKKAAGIDTIFIIDAFSKSLPDNLSKNIKRQSVLNIIDASKINLDGLVNDGLERIDDINSYLKAFSEHTNNILAQKETQVEALEEQIKLLKKEIKERNRLEEKQANAIELETHKIRTTLEFVTNIDNNAEE